MSIEIIHGDFRELVKSIKNVTLTLADPPYGIGYEYDVYDDTEENLMRIIKDGIPIFREKSERVLIFGNHQKIFNYPNPDWLYSYSWNTTGSYGKLGICQWQPILFYGEDIKGFGSVNGVLKSDVCRISGGDGVGFRRLEKINHPCPKPINIIKNLIARFTNEGDTIFDPFLGSGTTAIAAYLMRRNFIGCDISEDYVKEAKRRLKFYQSKPELFESFDGV